MKVSIAMAAYNGARFIRAQLDSFAAQTRLPDEVVICDDGSSDGTEEIVRRFAQESPFAVRFERNPKRLGYTRNFERAILRTQGDIIFLSDQDDVWFEDKLASVLARFDAEPQAEVVVNDQIITDAEGRGGEVTKLGNLKRHGHPDGLIEGCCTALSARWARLALPIPSGYREEVQHLLSYDRWLNELATFLGIRVVEERPLQLFRRHGGNTTRWLLSEPRKIGVRDLIATRPRQAPTEAWRRRVEVLDVYSAWLREKRATLGEALAADVERALGRIDDERDSHRRRIDLTRLRLPWRAAAAASLYARGGYRYFYGWKSALSDIIRSEG